MTDPIDAGNFHLIDLADITVGERFRKEIDTAKMNELIASIKARSFHIPHGLIEPIVVTRELRLIAGFRRMTAFKSLGRVQIPAQFIDEVDEMTAREIELEENIARQDMTWQETVRLRTHIHQLKIEKYGAKSSSPSPSGSPHLDGWSVKDTADTLGISPVQLHRDLALTRAMVLMPELDEETSKAIAIKKITRMCEDIERELALRDAIEARVHEIESSLWLGDCINEMAKIESQSVDLILTDPPYGVEYDSVGGSMHRTSVDYDDTPEAVTAILRSATKEFRRILKPNGHLYAFFGIQLWSETMAIYRSAGFWVDPLPLVWIKNRGGTVDWDMRYSPTWEPILFCTDKVRRLACKRENVFVCDVPGTRSHANEKPTALLKELILMSTQPNELVVDPFCGSGSTCAAAKDANRRFIGIEQDQRMYDIAKLRLMR